MSWDIRKVNNWGEASGLDTNISGFSKVRKVSASLNNLLARYDINGNDGNVVDYEAFKEIVPEMREELNDYLTETDDDKNERKWVASWFKKLFDLLDTVNDATGKDADGCNGLAFH